MSDALTVEQIRRLRKVFKMPSVQTMMSRKSSITNAFVSALIPVIRPAPREIAEALEMLGMSVDTVQCAYCGDRHTQWDHLRPLVIDRRPTGYISEIANLVPACGQCNQSKGNSYWHDWMLSETAPHSPARRGVPELQDKIARLRAYEAWRPVHPVPFEDIVGHEAYRDYWQLMDRSIEGLRECHEVAVKLKILIATSHGASAAVAAASVDESPLEDPPGEQA